MDIKIKKMHVLLLFACVFLVNTCDKSSRGSRKHAVKARVYGDPDCQTFKGTYTYKDENVGAHVGGSVNCNRDFDVEAGVQFRKRKRSVQSNEGKYNVTLHVDPCFFIIYDLDKNGEFSKDELQTIFGNDEKANALFADLDTDPSDGVVKEEELMKKAPQIITSCFEKKE